MPLHMRERFSLREMNNMSSHEPFSFTKNCPIWQVPSYGIPELDIDAYGFGTMLFDLDNDPKQQCPINNPEVEKKMIRHMIALMKENDSPSEQYERLGISAYME